MRARYAGIRLVASALAALLAWGCGAAGDGSRGAPGGRSVTLLVPPSERPAWIELARAHERRRPGARVEIVEGPQSTDLRENLCTASLLARDPTFDLLYLDVTWAPKFAAAGWLVPLDGLLSESELSEFLPAALATGRHRGRLYRVPVRTDCGLLYWRSDWLEEAGRAPPETFDELLAAAKALQDPPGRWGFVWQGKQYEGLVCAFLEVLHGFGGSWIDPETGSVALDAPEAIEALTFLRRCIADDRVSPPGVATYQEEESRRIFQDGRAVFLRNWPYAWRLAQAEGSPLRGKIGAGPMVRAEGGRRSATLGGWGLGISAFSRRPEEALDFIRFVTSLEGQRILCRDTGYAPARAEAYRDSVLLAANPFLPTIARVHADAVPRPVFPAYAVASDVLQRQLSAALAGSVSPETALRRAAKQTRRLVGTVTP
ncbi:MAG TPA: ABC transporter substrate-binding protein [Candidatus Eisenbacteria bacterium]|nr:ABC transporter substrate-binding protein [Candidatus Eisenbacteria bacterium]